ncbi:uncharacterized protein F4822DRAFT_426614 [Hypoxylon trugodes]|uniref:uncharacterized protein n=1 Tax=Hypoxylon trugodes TaxID=326681 RepID=UPI00219904E1|nr:uncharacterized protein F4822DRAFT_426614 [Hypoxylon trugodes]KAI1390769.1 hypothetical protein F4822DRAFT_426614 [Hypoxylon trugodes]
MDITPPRPIKPCEYAISTGSPKKPHYCDSFTRERTRRNDWDEAIVRDRPCIPCYKRHLQMSLDLDWYSLMRQVIRVITDEEYEAYRAYRMKIFEEYYYWDWQRLHANLLDDCRVDIQAKYGLVTRGSTGEDGKSPKDSAQKEGYRSTQYYPRHEHASTNT